jgi:hypothetical protein
MLLAYPIHPWQPRWVSHQGYKVSRTWPRTTRPSGPSHTMGRSWRTRPHGRVGPVSPNRSGKVYVFSPSKKDIQEETGVWVGEFLDDWINLIKGNRS